MSFCLFSSFSADSESFSEFANAAATPQQKRTRAKSAHGVRGDKIPATKEVNKLKLHSNNYATYFYFFIARESAGWEYCTVQVNKDGNDDNSNSRNVTSNERPSSSINYPERNVPRW